MFEHVLVDEYQDTNVAQLDLLKLLAGDDRNVCAVGDDDQAIYGWRGAEVKNILRFERHFPGAKEIRLEQNYRSTGNILACANAVIAKNPERRPKTLFTSAGPGDRVRLVALENEEEGARWIAEELGRLRREGRGWGDFAVLYRLNAQSRPIEEALREASMPYTVHGGPAFFDRAEVRDLVAWLKVCASAADEATVFLSLATNDRATSDISAFGRLWAVTYANGNKDQFSYDPLGQLTQRINARGQVINNTYNSMGQLAQETFADGTHSRAQILDQQLQAVAGLILHRAFLQGTDRLLNLGDLEHLVLARRVLLIEVRLRRVARAREIGHVDRLEARLERRALLGRELHLHRRRLRHRSRHARRGGAGAPALRGHSVPKRACLQHQFHVEVLPMSHHELAGGKAHGPHSLAGCSGEGGRPQRRIEPLRMAHLQNSGSGSGGRDHAFGFFERS